MTLSLDPIKTFLVFKEIENMLQGQQKQIVKQDINFILYETWLRQTLQEKVGGSAKQEWIKYFHYGEGEVWSFRDYGKP